MSKKAKKNPAPKRLAGVKVPKAYRKSLRKLSRKQDSRALLSEAVLAAVAGLAASQVKPGSMTRRALSQRLPETKDRARASSAAAGEAPGALSAAIAAAARAFLEELDRRSTRAASPQGAATS